MKSFDYKYKYSYLTVQFLMRRRKIFYGDDFWSRYEVSRCGVLTPFKLNAILLFPELFGLRN
jgi:hypothetical protein